jgi:hypothetical protein
MFSTFHSFHPYQVSSMLKMSCDKIFNILLTWQGIFQKYLSMWGKIFQKIPLGSLVHIHKLVLLPIHTLGN